MIDEIFSCSFREVAEYVEENANEIAHHKNDDNKPECTKRIYDIKDRHNFCLIQV